jgi:NADH-quinone oxidoreductase subunit M
MADATLLNYVLWLPVLGMAALLVLPRGADAAVRGLAFVVMLLQFLLAAWLYGRFEPGVAALQFETRLPGSPTGACTTTSASTA